MPRHTIDRFLSERLAHQRNAPTKTATGGQASSWSTVTASVKCCVYPIDTAARDDYARRDILVTTAIVTKTDAGAKATDRFYDSVAGVYYVVMGVEPYSNDALIGHGVYVYHCDRRVV